jgi:Gram positive anchor.
LITKLPGGSSTSGTGGGTAPTTTTTAAPGRPNLPNTGAQIGLLIVGALVLIGLGIFLRRKGRDGK